MAANPSYLRQQDWYDPAQHGGVVTMIGCGGVGSVAALALAKLGIPDLRLIDPDVVEPHNLPNQMFTAEDVGKPKVEAMAEMVTLHNPAITVEALAVPFEADHLRPGIVVSGLDSMEARSEVWGALSGHLSVALYLDARLGGQQVVLYGVQPASRPDQQFYAESLYSDDEAREDACTARSIIDVGFAVGSLIARAVRLQLTGAEVERILVHNQLTLNNEIGVREGVTV